MTRFTVETADLRAALVAIHPLAAAKKDSPLHRVRLHVEQPNLMVTATNGFAAGCALVSIEDGDGEIVTIDMSPTNAREITTLFKGREGDDDQPGDLVTIETGDGEWTITDTGGLFDGKALTLPDYGAQEHFPDVAAAVKHALNREHTDVTTVAYNAKLLAAFMPAARAYDGTIKVEPTGERTGTIITIGESFLGVLMPLKLDEDTALRDKKWREAWHRRLRRITDTPLEAALQRLADSGVTIATADGQTFTPDPAPADDAGDA